ncbi:hypothetical protein AQF98_07855 [Pedobacter sp. Hv1]|nr:hypothetical protein AQF98_07855 [Pedobacter sp. Hv1]
MLCLNFEANSQEIKPLKLGQKIPMAILQQTMPQLTGNSLKPDSLTLATYKGKFIILDFWATWCSSCIYQFAKLENLQQRYQDQIKILLINAVYTKDTPQRMYGILSGEKAPFIKSSLPSVYNDTVLSKLFPHAYLPHYVWLGPKGEFLALTNTDMLNEQTIKSVLEAYKQDETATAKLLKQNKL